MNPFETLSDDPILHIFSYLTRVDLLKLSQMDKKFYRIVTESKKTAAKIPLVVNFKGNFKLANGIDEVTELTKKRRFTALKIQGVNKTIPRMFTSLLQHLSGTVEHLDISSCKFNEKHFRTLVQLFLPKLKTCNISYSVNVDYTNSDKSPSKYPLSSLVIGNSDSDIVKYFDGCKLLKSFMFGRGTDPIFDFLSQQTRLEKLSITGNGIDFGRVNCFQLKELSIFRGVNPTVSKILQKLPKLTKLAIKISDQPMLHPTMTAICNVPELKDLNITIAFQNPAIPLERLVNHTVKKLRISDSHDGQVTCWILEIFRAVESVSLSMSSAKNFYDPSNVPHETIDKIKYDHITGPLHIKFSPPTIPVNIERFESAVMKFAKKFPACTGSFYTSITIGHQNWLNKENFSLSNSFCEGLVNQLPNLFNLELYNVSDCVQLFSFLEGNRKTFKNLGNVKFHKPTDDEPQPKKIKFEI